MSEEEFMEKYQKYFDLFMSSPIEEFDISVNVFVCMIEDFMMMRRKEKSIKLLHKWKNNDDKSECFELYEINLHSNKSYLLVATMFEYSEIIVAGENLYQIIEQIHNHGYTNISELWETLVAKFPELVKDGDMELMTIKLNYWKALDSYLQKKEGEKY